MKKTYVTPIAEKIEFDYSQQVVASAGQNCLPGALHVGQNNKGSAPECVGGIVWLK